MKECENMKVVVVGGGVSGMMAALNASLYHDVVLLERNESLGKKLLLTGNRRCNITNNKSNHDFINEVHNGKFLYSTFSHFNVDTIKQYFSDNRLPLIEEKQNRMYPNTERSYDVLNLFLNNLKSRNVEIKYNMFVEDLVIESNQVVAVKVNDEIIPCDHLILATGGVSFPMLGSDGSMHEVLKKHDVNITDLYPVEASLLSKDPLIKSTELVGLSFFDVEMSVINHKNKTIFKVVDDLLITHKGLSGPAALSCGEYVYKHLEYQKQVSVHINYLVNFNQNELSMSIKNKANEKLYNVLKVHLPKRLLTYMMNELKIDLNEKITSISNRKLEQLYAMIYKFEISVNKVESIKRAFVTGGGVSLSEVDSKTYKHKNISNLSICGELLDLHGPIGGYNLTIAMLSGMLAGSSVDD